MTSEPTTTTATTMPAGGDELDRVADRLVEQARTDGVALTGPGGLLGGLTKKVLETALAAELTDHLGYEHGDPRPDGNARNGATPKTVRTDIWQVHVDVPRDRACSFEPAVLPKSAKATEARFAEFAETWRPTYPALVAMWERSWAEFMPFLDFPVEIRKLIYTTNGIESLNSRFRQASRRRGHFPSEQAAMKVLYLTVLERRPNRANPTGRIPGWKSILNTLAITYGDRINIR